MKVTRALLAAALAASMMPLVPEVATAKVGATHELRLIPVVSGLTVPLDLRAPVGSQKLFIVELTGKIRVFVNGKLKKKPFLNLSSKISTGGERGLLGLAFHPEYADNGLFYVYYTDTGGDVRISEFSVSGKANVADANSERILLEIDEPYSNHNGGGLGFGPSGYLYIAVGDGGSGGDPDGNGQNTNTLLGSLLRIDVDSQSGGNQYAIPPSNPFVSGGGKEEIFAYGLRNPWRISIDQVTGRVYIGDVGQSTREEIDVVLESSTTATNFGWNDMEGTFCYQPPTGCDTTGKKLPVIDYPNPEQGTSVIGGYVYRGHAMPWLRGTYFYSDLSGRRLKSFKLVRGKARERTDWTSSVGQLPASVYGFGQDGLGELYVLSGSTVYRIEDANPARCDFNGDGDDDLGVGAPGDHISGHPAAGSVSILPSANNKPGPAGNTLWSQDRAGVGDVAKGAEGMGSSLACGDFDGDGYDDLAVGVPENTTPVGVVGGAVDVFYGSSSGLATSQLLRQGESGLGDVSETGDEYGAALTSGDFDGDGYDDLVVGVPGEDVGGQVSSGRINVIYGSTTGLRGAGHLSWSQRKPNIDGEPEPGDRFGSALVSGDFDGDGYSDLAVGVPDEDIGLETDAGIVQVFFGKRNDGLVVAGDIRLDQDVPNVVNAASAGDRFGEALGAGPIDADGYDDLVVGVPGDTASGVAGAGLAHYFPGSGDGPGPIGDRVVHMGKPGMPGSPHAGDGFGSAIDIGDIDGDGHADIVVGIPNRDVAGKNNAGAVSVIYGANGGISGNSELIHQNTAGVNGSSQVGDRFGYSVALLDFEEDGMLDLAIGIPYKAASGANNAGVVAILFGRSGGLTISGDLRLHQGKPGVNGKPHKGDVFGWALGR